MTLLMPLPVPSGVAAGAVQFLNSDRRQRFFKNLAKGFADPGRQGKVLGRCASWLHEYRTSRYYTPSPGEFRFVRSLEQLVLWLQRCGRPVPAGLPLHRYRDFGFVVGQLAPQPGRRGGRTQTLAPLALSFPVQATGSLFFPAVHFYAQKPLAPSALDHVLYCQPGTDFDFASGWQRSARASAWFRRGARTDAASAPIVDPASPCYRNVIKPAPERP